MNKLDSEPRLQGAVASVVEWARRVALTVNQLIDGLTSANKAIATKAPLNSPDLTGTPKAPTPPSSDNSTRIATTAWTKLGFAALFGGSGYFKFPDWMGGLILQWGFANGAGVTFPVAFATSLYGVWCSMFTTTSPGIIWGATAANTTLTGFTSVRRFNNTVSVGDASEGAWWLAIGK